MPSCQGGNSTSGRLEGRKAGKREREADERTPTRQETEKWAKKLISKYSVPKYSVRFGLFVVSSPENLNHGGRLA